MWGCIHIEEMKLCRSRCWRRERDKHSRANVKRKKKKEKTPPERNFHNNTALFYCIKKAEQCGWRQLAFIVVVVRGMEPGNVCKTKLFLSFQPENLLRNFTQFCHRLALPLAASIIRLLEWRRWRGRRWIVNVGQIRLEFRVHWNGAKWKLSEFDA